MDSIVVSDGQVEIQLDQRLSSFIERIGSREKLEDYFKKPIDEIKEDLRESVKEQMIVQKMQGEITSGITITPTEIREYTESLPTDSLPYIESKIDILQLIKYPPKSEEAEFLLRERLLELRKRVLNGESFSKLAVLYSEDGSAAKGGEIGFRARGELDTKYAEAAFRLREGMVSNIVESDFGYHLIQLIEKNETKVNTRHILMNPKFPAESIVAVRKLLDSIRSIINTQDTMTFEKAAKQFSDDNETKFNGGRVLNQYTGSPGFEWSQLEAVDHYILKQMKVGDISEPYEARDKNGKKIYKIIQLKHVTQPHRANLKEDYDLLKGMAENDKKQKVLDEWIKEVREATFIKINPYYDQCNFYDSWVNKTN